MTCGHSSFRSQAADDSAHVCSGFLGPGASEQAQDGDLGVFLLSQRSCLSK